MNRRDWIRRKAREIQSRREVPWRRALYEARLILDDRDPRDP